MNQPVRNRFCVLRGHSERTVMLGTIVSLSAVSAVLVFVLSQYFSIDVFSSLVFMPQDCYLDWGMKVGRHCFSDYALAMDPGMRPNPWEAYPLYLAPDFQPFLNPYPAAAIVPHVMFGLLGRAVGAPIVGLLGYMLVLVVSVFVPAVWAARGARGLERVVVFVACGAAAIPVWAAIDRGNSVGFVAPIALVFLVALCRQRWVLVALMVVLAALIKPQFVVLAVVLFAARRWRWGGIAVVGAVILNLAAYLLWPRDFPDTIGQSIHNALDSSSFKTVAGLWNISFTKVLLTPADGIAARNAGGAVPDGFLAGPRSLIGYAILILIVVCVLVLGRRIPPVLAGIMLLATTSLFPALTYGYYLVFALPIAALVTRDPAGPPGSGIFDRQATLGDHRRAVGMCVSLAAAITIAQVPLPTHSFQGETPGQLGHPGIGGHTLLLPGTTALLAPIAWLITCAVIIASYARTPAPAAPLEFADLHVGRSMCAERS